MTAALALSSAGLDPEVVEIGREWRGGAGGLLIQDSPLRALDTLGLVDALLERGFPHQVMNVCDTAGVVRQRNRYPSLLADKPPAIGIARSALAAILTERADAAAIAVRTGTTVDRLDQDGGEVHVTFTDGSTGTYDLVLGADGVHSRVRELVFGHDPSPQYTGQVIWRATAARPSGLDEYHMYIGAHSKVGVYPISDDQVYLFLLQAAAGEPPRAEGDQRELLRVELEAFGGHVPEVAQLLDPLVDFRGLRSLMVPSPWYSGRVLLIGDSAHATTPHIGYGLGIAVEDAIIVAELAASDGEPEAVFGEFMRRRFDRCKLVVENSRQLGEWEQNPPVDTAAYATLVSETLAVLAEPL